MNHHRWKFIEKCCFFSQFCRVANKPTPTTEPSCRHWTSQSGRPSVCACFLLISFLLRTGRRSEHGCTRILKSMRWIESRSAFCQLSFYHRDFIASSQLKSFLPECFRCLSSLTWFGFHCPAQDTKSWEVEYSLREIRTATIRQAPSAHHSVADTLQWKMAVQSFTTWDLQKHIIKA